MNVATVDNATTHHKRRIGTIPIKHLRKGHKASFSGVLLSEEDFDNLIRENERMKKFLTEPILSEPIFTRDVLEEKLNSPDPELERLKQNNGKLEEGYPDGKATP